MLIIFPKLFVYMVQSKYTIKRTELAKKTKNNKIDKKITKKVDKTLDSTSTNLTENVPDVMMVPDIIVPDIIEPVAPDIIEPVAPDIIEPDIVDIKPTKICQLKEHKKRKELEKKELETKKKETKKKETKGLEKKKKETNEMETNKMETNKMETKKMEKETNEMETNENIKTILITKENELIDETPPVKLKINKIGFKVAKVSVNSNLVVDHVNLNSEDVVDRGEEEEEEEKPEGKEGKEGKEEPEGEPEGEEKKEAPRKRKEVSKECMQLAIKILKKIDPKNQMKKEDVIIILKEYSQSVNDLAIIQAVEYLLDSFDNLEENFKNFEETRIKQEKGLFKTDRLDKETFENRISLDSEDREPDENDRIFRQGKEIFSGSFQKYKKKGNLEEEKFKSIIAPKKDLKKLKQYGLA